MGYGRRRHFDAFANLPAWATRSERNRLPERPRGPRMANGMEIAGFAIPQTSVAHEV